MKRSICAAGHKALFAKEFGGFPPNEFFKLLDPLLDGFTARLFDKAYTASESAGTLSKEWAERLGLSSDVIVGIGAFDAHMGAVGGQIEPYFLSKVMGTSTCDILVAPENEVQHILVKGICGQVPGSVIPGMMGMEAGQSAFGDAYAWFRNLLMWPLKQTLNQSGIIDADTSKKLMEESESGLIASLSKHAALLEVNEDDELAVDWFNGRRTPDANQMLEGAFYGLSLGSDAPRMFRAVAEATCFGARAIVERFIEEKIPVKGLIGMGGVAKKSSFIMQMMADIMQMPIRIHKSEQTCAAGAAMFAATAAGLYDKVEDAMASMGRGFEAEYVPDKSKAALYNKRYTKYKQFGAAIEHLTMSK
jgi:L-ribulokinase